MTYAWFTGEIGSDEDGWTRVSWEIVELALAVNSPNFTVYRIGLDIGLPKSMFRGTFMGPVEPPFDWISNSGG